MLLGFGIKSKLYENRRGGKFEAMLPDGRGGHKAYPVREMHSLRITRSSRVRFEREIGFMAGSPKVAKLARLNARVSTYSDELIDGVGSITPLGEEPVFDLTEQATSHFVANGLVVHNCSEFSFLNDTACNLASVNLMKFVRRGRRVRRRGLPVRLPRHDHRPGDPRRQRGLPDAAGSRRTRTSSGRSAWATRTSARCS